MTTNTENMGNAGVPVVEYGFVEPAFVHFDDLDSMGMVHNTRYAVLIERGLTTFWDKHGYTYAHNVPTHPDSFIAVVEFLIQYRAPVLGTGPILVHIWVDRMGTTSVTYGFQVLSADGKTVHAQGHRVHARLDPKTLRTTPWAQDTREIYQALSKPGEANGQADGETR